MTKFDHAQKELCNKLNDKEIMPRVEKGVVTLCTYTDNGNNERDLTDEELASIGFVEAYIDAHPEGSDRGGYVPFLFCVVKNGENGENECVVSFIHNECGDGWNCCD